MYSPQIEKHTGNLYRLSKAVGKPMTHVADDLMGFSFKCLKAVYSDLDDKTISTIVQERELRNKEEIAKSSEPEIQEKEEKFFQTNGSSKSYPCRR